MTLSDITVLPDQAERIAKEAAKTGAAVGVSQSGSALRISTGRETFAIDARGHDIYPPTQESLC